MPFPSDRFVRAGATPEQLASLQAAYDELTPAGQAGYDDQLAPLSDGGIIQEYLTDAPEPEPEPEEDGAGEDETKSGLRLSDGSTL